MPPLYAWQLFVSLFALCSRTSAIVWWCGHLFRWHSTGKSEFLKRTLPQLRNLHEVAALRVSFARADSTWAISLALRALVTDRNVLV